MTIEALVIGGGPAGLIAAEMLATAGRQVVVVDRMRTPGRKFTLAGRGGLNLTHSEPIEQLLGRYRPDHQYLAQAITDMPPTALRAWVAGLGEDTFVGTSGRVFPESMGATPLLRAWLERLARMGVVFQRARTWIGFDMEGSTAVHRFIDNAAHLGGGDDTVEALRSRVTVFALGGASWPGTGSDGAWVGEFRRHGLRVNDLQASNCGFRVAWSDVYRERHAGRPLKNVALTVGGIRRKGELMVTSDGLEGGLMYAAGHDVRALAAVGGEVEVEIDLRADVSLKSLVQSLSSPRGSQSMSTWLQKRAHLSATGIGLIRESTFNLPDDPGELARLIKAVPVVLQGTTAIARAISTDGGVDLDEVNGSFMVRTLPGVFLAGEMLSWDAPTGGYLLQASWSTGAVAGRGAAAWLRDHDV